MGGLTERLIFVQAELNAPKNQHNSFGGYNYRSCEDIVEAVKPLLQKYGMSLLLSDTIEHVGDRYYVKATATLRDCETDAAISVSASAREEETKKGMDAAQITGSASSYARKYALNGLFAIDDAKDVDTDEHIKERKAKTKRELLLMFEGEIKRTGVPVKYFCDLCAVKDYHEIPMLQLEQAISGLKAKPDKNTGEK